jgi:hypothetical protein
MSTLTIPCTWCRGSVNRMWSSSDHAQASTRDRTCASMLRWVVTTPLGRSVVPEVYRIIARRPGSTSGSRPTGPAASSAGVERSGMPRSAATGATRSTRSGWTATASGFASSRTWATSAVGWVTPRGTETPPARQIPQCAATQSQPGGTSRQTRASSRSSRPASKRVAAIADDDRRSWKVYTPSGATTARRSRRASARRNRESGIAAEHDAARPRLAILWEGGARIGVGRCAGPVRAMCVPCASFARTGRSGHDAQEKPLEPLEPHELPE